jgi:hypothetical protein
MVTHMRPPRPTQIPAQFTEVIVELSTQLLERSLTDGDERVAVCAVTCGASTTHPGRCPLNCVCWCHGPIHTARALRQGNGGS